MDITSIIQHVFKQPSLEGVALSELEKFTEKQPFFAVGQYLLLKKMQDIRDPGFEKQLQKTRLYFENPLWLQQLLLRKTDGAIAAHTYEESIPAENFRGTNDPVFEDNGNGALTNETEQIESPVHEHNEDIVEDITVAVVEENILGKDAEASETRNPAEETITAAEEIQPTNMVELAEQAAAKSEVKMVEEPIAEPIAETTPASATLDMPVETETMAERTESDSIDSRENSADDDKEEEGKPGFVLPPYSKPAEQTENQFVFQAYHTIDYFASQGIKISNKAEMSDKLGSQLKSFTEWLKTMKRLPPSKLEQQMEEKESEVVVEMAAHSLESKEVLTETMAEVLLKQGKKESAIEVYNKLSLLNPSKTPYFAAKIEAIKQN